jgi:hypothetical protein
MPKHWDVRGELPDSFTILFFEWDWLTGYLSLVRKTEGDPRGKFSQ